MEEPLIRYNVYNYLYQNLNSYLVLQQDKDNIDTLVTNELLTIIEAIVILFEGVENISTLSNKNSGLEYNYDSTLKHLESNFIRSNELLSNISHTKIASFKNIETIFIKKESRKLSDKLSYYVIKKLIFDYLKQVTYFSEEIFEYHRNNINIITNKLTIDLFASGSTQNILNNIVNQKAFLSYAYDDSFYTLGLFLLFLDQGILMYVDWIFNDTIDDIGELKKILSEIMSNCRYFIFLRTLNSELSMQGNSQIRQWCSWEIGTFYQYSNNLEDSKYYIETTHIIENKKQNNKILNDFNILINMSQLND